MMGGLAPLTPSGRLTCHVANGLFPCRLVARPVYRGVGLLWIAGYDQQAPPGRQGVFYDNDLC
jgi:hypothetical protein